MYKLLYIIFIFSVAAADTLTINSHPTTHITNVNSTIVNNVLKSKNTINPVATSYPLALDMATTLNNPIALNYEHQLNLKEYMMHDDIGLLLHNISNAPMVITNIFYVIDKQVCASSKQNITLAVDHSLQGYYVARSDLLNCYSMVAHDIDAMGNFKLIDITSNVNAIRYQQFSGGLLLYPISLNVGYVSNKFTVLDSKLSYLVFAKI